VGRRLGAVALGLGLALASLALLEGALRLTGIGAGAPGYDPLSGFSAAVPVFEPAAAEGGAPGRLRVSAARMGNAERSRPLEPQRQLRARKPEGGLRVFVVGGSTSMGVPYGTRGAFSTWLEQALRRAFPERPLEVVNAALSGYGSRRIRLAVDEIARLEPDLLVIYSGHNEYGERAHYGELLDMPAWRFALLERASATHLFRVLSRLRAPEEVDADTLRERFDAPRQDFMTMFGILGARARGDRLASAAQRRTRDQWYRRNVEAMGERAAQAGARVLLVSLVQNLSDWPPGASTLEVEGARREVFERAFETAERARARGDCEAAEAAYWQALGVDDSHAGAHFGRARCLRALGRTAEARDHFVRASDLDRVPYGAPGSYSQWLRELAGRRGWLFADAAAAFDAASGEHLVGDDLFVDFVHPNLAGQQLLARAVVDALAAAAWPGTWPAGPDDPWPAPEAVFAERPRWRAREALLRVVTCATARRTECVARASARLKALAPRYHELTRSLAE